MTTVDELRTRITGDVQLPDDDGYAGATLSWNRLYQHRPALVGHPASVADVVEMVRFANENGLPIGVQTTGHGPVMPVDDGMLIRTGRIDTLEIDPVAATARVGAGLTWGPVLAAAQEHGLAPLLGSSTGVGAVGYTLGGGFGWLARRHGMASDSVVSFDVVTTDGRLLTVSADEHPELFWALRGGGAGSIAVVVAMEISLYPIDTVYAGNLYYPAELAPEVIRRWREWTTTAPVELTSSVVLMNFPPFDEVPEPLRGQSFVIVRGCHSGSTAAGEEAMRYWREWQSPLMDMWGEMPFTQADTISNDPTDPMPVVFGGGWLTGLSDDAIDVLVSSTYPAGGPPALVFSEVRHAGAVVSDANGARSAYGNPAEYLMSALGIGPEPAIAGAVTAHLDGMIEALSGVRAEGAYLNFLDGPSRRLATRRGVSDFDRLAAVKAEYDPTDAMSHGLDLTR